MIYPYAFNVAIKVLLGPDPVKPGGEEGGYSNDPDDPGGETNFGLDKRSHPDLDLAHITKPEAVTVYWNCYWSPYAFDHFADEITEKLFDVAVNAGFTQANKFLQRAVGLVGIQADGIIGPKTLATVKLAEPHAVHLAIIQQQEAFYEALVASRPADQKYLKGWLKRALA